jgi:NADH:ubiquinone oxidoreductase subunit 4 (subunit M)
MRRIFFGPLPEHLKEVKEAPLIMTVPLLVFAIIVVIIGIYPKLVTDNLLPYFAQALNATASTVGH